MHALTATSLIGSLVAGLALLTAPVSAREWAGPVDMQLACDWQYGTNYDAYLKGSGANDWYCQTCESCAGNGIGVDSFCKRRYRDDAYADPQGGGAYDWGCYYP